MTKEMYEVQKHERPVTSEVAVNTVLIDTISINI